MVLDVLLMVYDPCVPCESFANLALKNLNAKNAN